jgi:RNA polymerase sigma factor (sigma-70 family)
MQTTAAVPIEQAQEDPADFAALYDRYVERIYRFIYSRVHERLLAEDITEEVFLKALKNIKSYRQMGLGCGPWLYRIATNAITDHYRRSQRLLRLESGASDSHAADNVLEVVVRRDQVRRVWRAMEQLPPQQRKAMVLRFSSDLPIGDVARLMNKSSDAVKLLVYRAVQRLRRDLVPIEA